MGSEWDVKPSIFEGKHAPASRHSPPQAPGIARLGGAAHHSVADAGSDAMAFKCTIPAVRTVQHEDSVMRISRWDFAPGAATGWHSHGWPYFVVLLTDAVMKIDD